MHTALVAGSELIALVLAGAALWGVVVGGSLGIGHLLSSLVRRAMRLGWWLVTVVIPALLLLAWRVLWGVLVQVSVCVRRMLAACWHGLVGCWQEGSRRKQARLASGEVLITPAPRAVLLLAAGGEGSKEEQCND